MNNKKQSDIQFTELTPDDIATHEDLYINLLVGVSTKFYRSVDKKYQMAYYEYVIKEVQKANDLFLKEFG